MEFIYFAGLIQAWFAALLVNRKPQKGPSDFVLIVWLLIIGGEMLISLLNLRLLVSLPDLIIVPLLYGPLLFVYTYVLVSKENEFPKKYFLHFIPFFVFLIVPFVWKGNINIDTIDFWKKGSTTVLSMFNYSTFLVSTLYYVYVVFKIIKQHRAGLSDHFSFDSKELRLDWIKLISLWFIGAFLASLQVYGAFLLWNIYPFNPIFIFHAGIFIFIFSISYYGIYQPQLYNPERKDKKLKSSVEAGESFDDVIGKLNEFMINNKPYLYSELTIQDLANDVNIQVAELSSALNHGLNKNFFTYINEYRVEEAKERIHDEKHKHLTLLAIGYDSGFNSKSSFNSLFKKHTGLTPSQFKR